ncbi:hypothetical protein [Beihai Nido-like virus 2]|uniref:Uncharacterized protein n=1 Tax=Beihai Nido-like virus 2 TaxID=1922351 RepID=A0A1L3KJ17_9NIDO|nr:hypothetical protein [Beihai Nido-like virus 2]APG77316.1 hypothetical protein [Beihai Nido-like virus 2]
MALLHFVFYLIVGSLIAYYSHSSRIGETYNECERSFNCTLNTHGVCELNLIFDLFFACYPLECIDDSRYRTLKFSSSEQPLKCVVYHQKTYPCQHNGVIQQCPTAYYSYFGPGNLLWVISVWHLTLRYLQFSVLGLVYLFYTLCSRLSPVFQIHPSVLIITVLTLGVTIGDYYYGG